MFNLREGFVNLREGFVEAPWRLREAFSKTRSAKASRRRHGRLRLETIRQIMTSPRSDRESDQRTHEAKFSCLATGIACLGGRFAPTNQHKWQGARGSLCLQHAESAFDGYNRGGAVLV